MRILLVTVLIHRSGQTVTVGSVADSTLEMSSKTRMSDSSTLCVSTAEASLTQGRGPNWTIDTAYNTLSGVGGNIMVRHDDSVFR